jgi:hypothetical protein
MVLPEDERDHRIATGFEKEVSNGQLQVLPPAGGWRVVLEKFRSDEARYMLRNHNRHMILLIDFDGRPDERLTQARDGFPRDLKDRVYIVGALNEPEDLRREHGLSYEAIGKALAEDCRHDTISTWNHALLQHNALELERLRTQVRPILFPPA